MVRKHCRIKVWPNWPTFNVKFDMFANNVAQFGHHVGEQIQVKKCSWHVCTCSKHFHEHFLFDRMLSNLATMFANNSTQSACKMDFRLKEKGLSSTRVKKSKWSKSEEQKIGQLPPNVSMCIHASSKMQPRFSFYLTMHF